MLKKTFVLLLILALAVVAILNLSRSRAFQLYGGLVNRVDIDKKLIALTFDDGPMEGYTQRILQTLNELSVKSTFFLVGAAMERKPHLARLIIDEGHEVGNHSYSHQRMWFMSYDEVAFEIEKTSELIEASGYLDATLFRPPYGKKLFNLPRYLSQHNIVSVTWDLEPETDQRISKDKSLIAEYIVENAKPGSIILLHVMFEQRSESMAAVPIIIKKLRDQGYEFVTVSQLLEHERSILSSLN